MLNFKFNIKELICLVVISIGVSLIILTYIFMKGELENFNLSSKINDEKIANFFTSAGFIIGIISVGGLLLQSWQYIKEKSPYVYPQSSILDLHSFYKLIDTSKLEDVNVFCTKFIYIEYCNNVSYTIQLKNVGIGIAKDINYEWEYSKDQLLKFIQNRLLIDYIIPDEKRKLEKVHDYINKYFESSCDKVLNLAPGQSVEIQFPMHYLLAFVGISNPMPIYTPPIPLLQLTIKYKDIFGSTTCGKFDVYIYSQVINMENNERKYCFKVRPYEANSRKDFFMS